MKIGEKVLFTEKGVQYNAIVMAVNPLDAGKGSSGEPKLALAFFVKPFVPEFRYDVAHQSADSKGSYWSEDPLNISFDGKLIAIDGNPSAADLDKAAEDKKAAEQTSAKE
jgi:hypothetical protein